MSEDAIQRYEMELAEDPRSRAFAPLAEAYRKAGRLDDAINTARTGLEVHPGYSAGIVVLGRALYEKGELDNAAEILQMAVNETPENYMGQKFLGKVLMDKGENSDALRALEAANLLSPEDEEVARLLEEVKSKATAPQTIKFEENTGESDGAAQIVTYEQKPTTVDGIELPPLPAGPDEETFSFSGGGTVDPADITPVPVDEQVEPAEVELEDIAVDEIDEEEMTATVIEDDEVEQTMEIESIDELGPEVAAFMQEGEDAMVESMDDFPEDSFTVEEDAADDFAIEIEDTLPVEPPPPPAPVPDTASEPEPVPAAEFTPEPAPETVPVAEPVPTAEPAGEDQFSTETLADLYAQQGLIEKAVTIYRQILDQAPDNEAVKLKLDALETNSAPGYAGEAPSIPETGSKTLQMDEKQDTLSILEGLLENVERIKRP